MAHMIADLLSRMAGGKKVEHRIIMLGLDASGRTTTLYMLKLGQVVTTIPTIGFNVETIDFKHPKLGPMSITAWDVGGCDKIRPLWRHHFKGVGGLVFFVDSNDYDRIGEAYEEIQFLMKQEETLQGVPLLVVANKQDLPNAMSVEEVERRLKLGTIKGREVRCLPAVANKGEGLWEAVMWITEAMHTYLTSPERRNKPPPQERSQEEEPILTQWLKIEDGSDQEFIQALENFTLDSWDHRTHLRLAWLYLTLHGRREGMRRIFSSIKAFIENSPRTKRKSGNGTTFHATLTYTWAHLVDFAIASTKNPTGDFKTFLMLNPQLSNGGLPLHYYTKKLLFDSAASRQEVVLPDKRPLPSIVTNIWPLKARVDASKLAPPPGSSAPLTDAQFLEAVRDRSLNGWGHAAMLRVVWACLRLHGVHKGPDVAVYLLRGFQGQGFHATITSYWCKVLGKLMVHDWTSAVARLDKAAAAREAAWKLEAAARLEAQQASLNASQWANDLLRMIRHGPDAPIPQQQATSSTDGEMLPQETTIQPTSGPAATTPNDPPPAATRADPLAVMTRPEVTSAAATGPAAAVPAAIAAESVAVSSTASQPSTVGLGELEERDWVVVGRRWVRQ